MRNLRETTRFFSVLVIAAIVCAVLGIAERDVQAQSSGGRSIIAFVTADYDTRTMTISLVDPDSGIITPLLNDGNFFFPMLSPDGRHLVFEGEHPRTKKRNLYIIGTDGSSLRLLVEAPMVFKPAGQVAWSPDSTQVIFGVLDRTLRPGGFFRVSLDGGTPQEIEFPDITDKFIDTWITASPDGSRLAVQTQKLDAPYRQLYIANVDGSNALPITAATADGLPFDRLVWSSDGQQTLLSVLDMNAAEPQALMLGDANGTTATPLVTPPPNYISSTTWSPDSSRIAFVATEMNADGVPDMEVWVANADGSGVRPLNIPINIAPVGISWRVIPDEVVLPSAPTSFTGVVG